MYEIGLDGGCVIISFASSNEYMNMNWSLYIYLLAIVENIFGFIQINNSAPLSNETFVDFDHEWGRRPSMLRPLESSSASARGTPGNSSTTSVYKYFVTLENF